MWLTPENKMIRGFLCSFLGMFFCISVFSAEIKTNFSDDTSVDTNDDIHVAERYYNNKEYREASKKFQEVLNTSKNDSLYLFKKLAFSYAKSNQPELACEYINKYVVASLDLEFVSHSYFKDIDNSKAYQTLKDRYLKKIDVWSIFCVYVGFIGFFIAVVLNLRKRSDKIANLLMSIFIFIHSVFIIHISLLITNYRWYVPHNLYASTAFSFLYGPLIYFYFKRTVSEYKFKAVDILHLLPTIILIGFLLLPVYLLSEEEKLRLQLQGAVPHGDIITVTKLVSLIVYGVMIIRIYFKYIKKNKSIINIQYKWQRNVVIFCLLYILTYSVYAFLIMSKIFSGVLFNLQVGLMASLVLYVSYTAFVSPSIFGRLKVVKQDSDDIEPQKQFLSNKYEKSGLTDSLSLELKNKLLTLLDEEKVYRQNDITLQKLANMLDTTRHNASQIVNEHFGINFFDLINKYRIQEAMLILRNEKSKKINIIDVAYEVGFNNKVTFNKSFKKYNHITPSEYMKSQQVA